MNLCSPLIKSIRFRFFRLRLNTSYQTVLKCYAVFEDALLSDFEKIDVCLYLLIKEKPFLWFLNPQLKVELFNEVFKKFIDVSDKKKNGEKHFDFTQDAEAIYSSFWQCYHIDLIKRDRKLHWWSFISLFNGLSEDTKMMQIISIRTRPIPKPTKYNADERRQIIRLKQFYQLELSEEERKKQFQEGLAKVAVALHGLAQRTDK